MTPEGEAPAAAGDADEVRGPTPALAVEGPLFGVRVFSSASDAQRVRRPTDAVILLLVGFGIAFISFAAPGPTGLDTATADLVGELPGLLGGFWEITYDLLLLWPLVLLLIPLIAHGRKRLFLDELLAVALGIASAIAAGLIAGTDPSTSLDGLVNSSSPPIYIATRVAVATAVIVTASPHMVRPVRHLGRWLIALGALASIALGAALPIGVLAGFLIGLGAASVTHLLVGSPGGRLTLKQVARALGELGVATAGVVAAPRMHGGVDLFLASTPDGRELLVKVFGRDAWDGQLVASVWESIWSRDRARHVGHGRFQQVEHEAFVTLLAQRGGVPVLPVVAAGEADQGDALLVLERVGSTSLDDMASDEIDDGLLRGYWDAVGRLHHVGVTHGRLTGSRLLIAHDGSPHLFDLAAGNVAATRNELMSDRAQLLVSTTLAVGPDRAIRVAIEAIGNDGISDVLPLLQPAVLDRKTRAAVKDQDWSLGELREAVAQRSGSEIPELEEVRRITWRSLIKLGVGIFLAYAIISAVADVGLDSIVAEFEGAEKGWLLAALLLSPLAQFPQAVSTMGATLKELTFVPVLMLQYGIQFIALAIPSSAARVALEVRFFQRVGVPGAGAVSIGMLDSFSTFLIQIAMIVIILASGMASLDLSGGNSSSSDGSGSDIDWAAIAIAIALIVLAFIIALLMPKTRALLHRLRGILTDKAEDARDAMRVLHRPKKLVMLLGGNLVAQTMLAIILGLCLKAFGYSATLAELLLVNTFVSLFAGFMPVPGGVGVAEAGYTAGLIAIGIPEAAATSTAVAFRMVTFYLPPIWGGFATKWLERHSYL